MVYICMGITYTYCISGVASQIFGDLFEKIYVAVILIRKFLLSMICMCACVCDTVCTCVVCVHVHV